MCTHYSTKKILECIQILICTPIPDSFNIPLGLAKEHGCTKVRAFFFFLIRKHL